MSKVKKTRTDVERTTREWIRNAADEKAFAAGMLFNAKRGQTVCDWIEEYCCLYEGEFAGKPFKLLPYQREATMRLFGWVRWSEEWNQWIRRFTHGSFWAAKKNGKSPWLAALELYMLCGDGEQGQKVYTAAKNGDQAKIAQRHALEMVRQSPQLSSDCKIHQATMAIQHLPTKSAMIILTGDDSRGAKSKEGLNGSVFIDECHVVDFEMMERVGRAGISRKEPLNFSVSTAGDDPSSYGHERFAYGQQVNAGDRDDPHFLHVEFCSPAKATDAEIAENLEEYGKAANPAWGEIVKPSEFRADYERSRGNPREMARFKQYRLNLWVGSTNQWLDTVGWAAGERKFGLNELRGRDCFIGIDLSRTRDMTAVVYLFPWPDEQGQATSGETMEAIRLFPRFWLPEATARARQRLFPFESWSKDGSLTLTPGSVVDYHIVEDDLCFDVESNELRVLGLCFDQHYAEEITQRIAERLGLDEASRLAVPQSLMGLSPLAKEFERRVSVGLVQHPGNPVMTWQIGHVQVWADRNQNIRPVKPSPHSGKSIDGVMAALDCMAGIAKSGEMVNADAGGFESW